MQKLEVYRFLKSAHLQTYKRLGKKHYITNIGLVNAFRVYKLAHGKKARNTEDVIVLNELKKCGIIAYVA